MRITKFICKYVLYKSSVLNYIPCFMITKKISLLIYILTVNCYLISFSIVDIWLNHIGIDLPISEWARHPKQIPMILIDSCILA